MRHRSRAVAGVGSLIAGLVLSGGAPAPVTGGVEVRIEVTDLRNAQGMVMACMTRDEARFPRCRGDAASYRVSVPAPAAGDSVTIAFSHVAPGRYAVALLHDENENGEADRAAMIPREGYGFSRDAPVRMGPPHFAAAAFPVGSQPVHQTIRMRYML